MRVSSPEYGYHIYYKENHLIHLTTSKLHNFLVMYSSWKRVQFVLRVSPVQNRNLIDHNIRLSNNLVPNEAARELDSLP